MSHYEAGSSASAGEANNMFRPHVRSKNGSPDNPPSEVTVGQKIIRRGSSFFSDGPNRNAPDNYQVKDYKKYINRSKEVHKMILVLSNS
jgi:hypothetical protein